MNAGNNPPKQLMMVRHQAPIPDIILREGWTLRAMRAGEGAEWTRVCQAAGFFTDADPGRCWDEAMGRDPGVRAENVLFACDPSGVPMATATARLIPEAEREKYPPAPHRLGYLHYVAATPECRGKGAGTAVTAAVLKRFEALGYGDCVLTTDDPRLPAISIYLKLGWLPVLHAPDMRARWARVLGQLGFRSDVAAFGADGAPVAPIVPVHRRCDMRILSIKPSPDFTRMETVLKRGTPDRVPVFELYSNIQKDILDLAWAPDGRVEKRLERLDPRDEAYRGHVRYMHMLGYDYINVFADGFDFPMKERESAMTNEGRRAYVNSHSVTVTGWQEFERYNWPDPARADYSRFERAPGFLPDGMKVIAWYSGILEFVMWLLGYEGVSYLMSDDEALVAAMFDAVGSRLVRHYDTLASYDCVGAVAMGDDMGFKTATMLSPATYRKYLFPWYRKLVDAAHRHGKPAILHSCGNLDAVMEDVIACGWDAKHSFEDAIEPVWEAKKKYGGKIALLGGFDLDKLTRMTEQDVRRHARYMMETCAAGGGWAMGTGNSVPEYIPAGNFLAMMEEALR